MTKTFLSAILTSSILATPLAANALEVTLGGEMKFQVAFNDQDDLYQVGRISRDTTFSNDTEIHVNVSGQASNGVRYGAVVELEADVSDDARDEGTNSDKTYIWAEGAFGRVELGDNEGAESAMAVTAASIARATGGIDGDFELYANTSGLSGNASFIITPDLPSRDIGGIAEDASKITYYTPDFNGASFGISYTPDTGNGGTAAGFSTDNDAGDYENVIGAAFSLKRSANGIFMHASVEGEIGDAELAGTEDLEAWQVGALIRHEASGVSIAGSYGDHGESGFAEGSDQEAEFWTAGIAYDRDDCACGISVTYLNSERGDNDFENIVVGLDYEAAPGFTPYFEFSIFDAEEAGVPDSNDGSVVLSGAIINF